MTSASKIQAALDAFHKLDSSKSDKFDRECENFFAYHKYAIREALEAFLKIEQCVCPFENCDLTLAYMKGVEDERDKLQRKFSPDVNNIVAWVGSTQWRGHDGETPLHFIEHEDTWHDIPLYAGTNQKSVEIDTDNEPAHNAGKVDLDAQKWRALISSQRITALGWAGFNPPEDNFRHLTLNFWTHNEGGDAQDKMGRDMLEQYVGVIMSSNEIKPAPAENSGPVDEQWVTRKEGGSIVSNPHAISGLAIDALRSMPVDDKPVTGIPELFTIKPLQWQMPPSKLWDEAITPFNKYSVHKIAAKAWGVSLDDEGIFQGNQGYAETRELAKQFAENHYQMTMQKALNIADLVQPSSEGANND